MPDYLIKTIIPGRGDHFAEPSHVTRERIIRAKNEAAAIKFVVADTITVDRATLDDAIRVGKIEKAGEEKAE